MAAENSDLIITEINYILKYTKIEQLILDFNNISHIFTVFLIK